MSEKVKIVTDGYFGPHLHFLWEEASKVFLFASCCYVEPKPSEQAQVYAVELSLQELEFTSNPAMQDDPLI